MGKRKGYNWRARVDLVTNREKQNGGVQEDTNVLELPSKTRIPSETAEGRKPPRKRKKLNSRQKKHFKKILERKEKKAKVFEIIRTTRVYVT